MLYYANTFTIGVVASGFTPNGEIDQPTFDCFRTAMSIAAHMKSVLVIFMGIQKNPVTGETIGSILLERAEVVKSVSFPDGSHAHADFHATSSPDNPKWHEPEPAGTLNQAFDYQTRVGLSFHPLMLVAPFSRIEILKQAIRRDYPDALDRTSFVSVG